MAGIKIPSRWKTCPSHGLAMRERVFFQDGTGGFTCEVCLARRRGWRRGGGSMRRRGGRKRKAGHRHRSGDLVKDAAPACVGGEGG